MYLIIAKIAPSNSHRTYFTIERTIQNCQPVTIGVYDTFESARTAINKLEEEPTS